MAGLKLLGGAVVTDATGAPGGITSRRHPVALLALLATAPSRTLSRGKLVGLLWPEAPEKAARNRLTSAVYHVRTILGEDVLLSRRGDLRFNEQVLPCDVCRFEDALAVADYDTAVGLYDGPFLDGFHLPGSVAFDQRVDRERDRLRRSYHSALESLARAAAERGDADAAAGWWRARAAEEPHDSRVARALMEALSAAGSPAEALRVGERHIRLLEREFGTGPDPAFDALVARLRTEPGRALRPPAVAGAEAPPQDLPTRSIAVLPFETLGDSEEAAGFAAGLHEDLLTELSRISALTVISRTSVRRYRTGLRQTPDIARELGVGTIVEGAVQSVGSRLRLNVQLIDARADTHRWVERYDRDLSDRSLFDIQAELAVKIARTLRAELTPEERQRVGAESTADLEAFRLYAQGRGLLDQRTRREMVRSIDYFRRAIERDPEYALAWSGLADAGSLLEFYDYPAPERVPDPLEAAERAVALGPELGQTHGSLGIIRSIRQHGPGALMELERAVELAPSYAEAHVWLGWVHLLRGAPEEALAPARRGVALDPLAPAYRVYLAETWLANGEGERALREAVRAREIQPEYGLAHFMEGLVLYHLGRPREVVPALDTARGLVPPSGMPSHAEIDGLLAVIHADAGREPEAERLLEYVRGAEHAFSTGLVHAALGRVDEAFAAFRRVREWGAFSTEHLRYFFPRVLGPLRGDPRFRELVEAVDGGWARQPDAV